MNTMVSNICKHNERIQVQGEKRILILDIEFQVPAEYLGHTGEWKVRIQSVLGWR